LASRRREGEERLTEDMAEATEENDEKREGCKRETKTTSSFLTPKHRMKEKKRGKEKEKKRGGELNFQSSFLFIINAPDSTLDWLDEPASITFDQRKFGLFLCFG